MATTEVRIEKNDHGTLHFYIGDQLAAISSTHRRQRGLHRHGAFGEFLYADAPGLTHKRILKGGAAYVRDHLKTVDIVFTEPTKFTYMGKDLGVAAPTELPF